MYKIKKKIKSHGTVGYFHLKVNRKGIKLLQVVIGVSLKCCQMIFASIFNVYLLLC